MNAPASTKPELWIRRTFDAPRSLVFEAWTRGEHLIKWCCPAGFTIPHSEADIRPGGSFRTCMRSPDGQHHWVSGTYTEIVPQERIVFTHAWDEDNGSPGHETVVTVTLAEIDGDKTRLRLHQAFFLTESSRDGHLDGWNQTLDSLLEYVSK